MQTPVVKSIDRDFSSTPNKSDSIIAKWLFILCGMVFFMVLLGGLTRLTHSGLSMVNWRPLLGWLPPIGHQEWQFIFDLYKETPEFKIINYDMTLDGFKSIFWLEYGHRLWGRLMGLAFILPFAFFLAKGWVNRRLFCHLVIILLLGTSQGVLGWYMVKSGLVDNPDVSQYRLTSHLSVAFLIYGYMLWIAMSLLRFRGGAIAISRPKLLIPSICTLIWIFLTMLSGGFVAGLDAGLTYNTFPLMDGQFIPDGLWKINPWYINLFENVTTVQFDHRIFAETTLLLVAVLWIISRKTDMTNFARKPFNGLLIAVLAQVILGIVTLIFAVPVFFASLHQIGAIVLFTVSLWTVHSLFDNKNSFEVAK